jgi:dihydrofolate reductase
MIRAIIAADTNNGIGKNGTLPWPHNSADLKWFKNCTNNSVVVMGRHTWEDPKMPKPLPNRYNVVVSNSYIPAGPNLIIRREDNIKVILSSFAEDVWIIGGAKLINNTKHLCKEIWVSRIKGDYKCDTFVNLSGFTLAGTDLKSNGLIIERYKNEAVS